MNSIFRAAEQWHLDRGSISPIMIKRYWKEKWGSNNTETWRYTLKDSAYEILEIKDGKTLFNESEIHKHCVFSYIKYCVNGGSRIFRMSKIFENISSPILTIELKRNTIVQVAGKFNRPASAEEITILTKWAEKMNFDIEFQVSHQFDDNFELYH